MRERWLDHLCTLCAYSGIALFLIIFLGLIFGTAWLFGARTIEHIKAIEPERGVYECLLVEMSKLSWSRSNPERIQSATVQCVDGRSKKTKTYIFQTFDGAPRYMKEASGREWWWVNFINISVDITLEAGEDSVLFYTDGDPLRTYVLIKLSKGKI